MAAGTSPGWYPDPTDPAGQRYYDGCAFTGQTAPASPSAPSTTASAASPTESSAQPSTAEPSTPETTEAPPPPGEPGPFEVVDYAWTQMEYGAGVEYVAVVTNPNTSAYGTFPKVRATARSKSGEILGTDEHLLMNLPPGKTLAFATDFQTSRTPDKVTVEFVDINWVSNDTSPGDYKDFKSSNVSFSGGGHDCRVTGEIANPYPQVVEARVAAVLRDARGDIIGGGDGLSDLTAKGKTPVQIDYNCWSDGTVSTVDLYAYPWLDYEVWSDVGDPF